MKEDARDRLEVLTFDLIEDTVGSWLRAIIRRLEKELSAIRRDQHKRSTSSREMLRGTPLHQKHHRKCARPRCAAVLHGRRQVLPISGRSDFGKLV
jgi:hypothetical protein